MQKPSTLAGQCAKGHDVYVTRDLNGDIDGGTIGTELAKPLEPLPEGGPARPIIVACDHCVKFINDLLQAKA